VRQLLVMMNEEIERITETMRREETLLRAQIETGRQYATETRNTERPAARMA